MTSAEIAHSVRTDRLTVRSSIEEALEAAAAKQPNINAFTEIDADGALARADQLDRQHAEGRELGPLAGVPIVLKDLIDHAGHVTTCGSSFYRHQATSSAEAVERLEAAGGVIIGRSGLHEFAFGFSSENPWFGPVRNPWNADESTGGSSGGSAAAVSAGIVPLAIGTDTGGSVRVPAALCGTWGLKVTHGRIPLSGVFPLAGSLDTVGPLGSSVSDLTLAYRAMAGYAPGDPWSVPDSETRPRPITRVNAPRLGIPQPWVEKGPTSREVRASFQQGVDALTELGASVFPVEVPELEPFGMGNELAQSEIAEVHRRFWEDESKVYGADVHERLAEAFEVTLDQAIAARRWRAGIRNAARRIFEHVDFLITPSVGAMHKSIGVDNLDLDGASTFYRPVFSWYSALVNQLGLPALSAPLAAEGSPSPSIQLIGPAWSEERLLELGDRLERTGMARFRPAPG